MDIIQRFFKGDKGVWIIFALLSVISILEFFSSSSSLSYNSANHWSPLSKHITLLFLGFLVMVTVSHISYVTFRFILVYLLGFFAVGSLIYASVRGYLGMGLVNDTSRWIYIPGTSLTLQPSELVKLWLIALSSHLLSRNLGKQKRKDARTAITIICFAAIPIALIFFENLSTALLICVVLGFLMIIGQINFKVIGSIIGIAAIFILFIFLLAKAFPETSALKRVHTWVARIENFGVNDKIPPSQYDMDKNAQRGHASIAISKSGIIGVGIGNSTQRDFLSHAYSDLIFAIILEETGLIGGAFTVLLYIMLIFRIGRISNRADDPYAILFIQGIGLMITCQALIHMAVAVDIIPITGQPLPIISKGGSSVLINCLELGLLLGISEHINKSVKEREKAELERAEEHAETEIKETNNEVV